MIRVVVGVLVPVLLAGASVTRAGIDEEIAFHEERVARDPGDFISRAWLARAHLRKARMHCDPAPVARAAVASEQALALLPDYPPALVTLAAARNAQHRFPEAHATAQRAARREPASPDVWAVLGDVELARGALAAARAAYDAAHALMPRLASHARLAAWRAATGDDAGALAAWQRALDAGAANGDSPEDLAWVHVQRGAHRFARGRFEDAGADYEAARGLDSESCTLRERLAELRAAEGRSDEAAVLYERAAAVADRPDLLHTIGDFFASIGKRADAERWYDRAEAGYRRSVDAGEALYHHHLASFYADARPQPATAVAWARKDLAARESSAAYDALAWALYKSGDAAAARTMIDRALGVGASDPHLLQHAALIYAADGASADGAVLLRKAYALNPRLDRFHAHR